MATIDPCVHGNHPSYCKDCNPVSTELVKRLAQGQIDWMRRYNEKVKEIESLTGKKQFHVMIPTVDNLVFEEFTGMENEQF